MSWGKFLFSFDGRISRKGFWLIFVATFVIMMIIQVVALAPMMAAIQSGDPAQMEGMSMPVWIWLVFLPLFWISLAAYAKRFHDQDKSGWLTLLVFIPLVNLVMLIIAGFIAGTPGPNRFGEGPMM